MSVLNPKTFKFLIVLYAVFAFIIYILNIVQVAGPDGSFFIDTFETRQKGHASPMLPEMYIFTISWVIIYLFDAGWIAYVLHASFIRKKFKDSDILHYVPVSYWVVVMSAGLAVLHIIWILAWDRDRYYLTMGVLVLYTGLTVATLILGVRDFQKYANGLEKKDFIIITVLVHNGVAIKFAWLLYQTGLNFATVLYSIAIPMSGVNSVWKTIDVFNIGGSIGDIHLVSYTNAGYGAYGLIIGFSMIYALVDCILFSNNLRFVVSPYFVWAYSFLGTYLYIHDKGYDTIASLATTSAVLMLIIAGVKIFLMKFLKYKKPGAENDEMIENLVAKLTGTEDLIKQRKQFDKKYGHLFKNKKF